MAKFEKRTLQQQIQSNQRMSLVYSALMIVLLSVLGASIAGYFSPNNWYWGAIAAGGAGILLALINWFAGSSVVLSVSHAREATPYEQQILDNVTEEMAIAAGIPKPQVYLVDDPAPNAFATGSDPRHGIVVVTTGLMRMLDRDELQGVVAHEISHIRNQDVRLLTTLAVVAGLIPLLADMFSTMVWYGGGRRRDKNEDQSGGIWIIVGLVFAILAPIFARLIELAVSRRREYLADATAAQLTRYPQGLASALQKISLKANELQSANRALQHMYIINPFDRGDEPDEDRESSLFSSHPSTAARIAALRSLMGSFPDRQARE